MLIVRQSLMRFVPTLSSPHSRLETERSVLQSMILALVPSGVSDGIESVRA